MSEKNLEILKQKMKEEGFSEEEIKIFEIKIILSQDLDSEEKQQDEVDIVSFEEYFYEN